MYKCMDNNVIVPVNSMRVCTLYDVGHDDTNVHCLSIVGAVFVFYYREQEQKDRMKI